MLNPRATDDDLTAKARARNAALDLFARHGESRVSMRAVATEAGVTPGLVQHHFKTKSGLVEAVDQLVVDYFDAAISSVPPVGKPKEVAAARDQAVRQMLRDNPVVVNYIRRAVLEPETCRMRLLQSLVTLIGREVASMRDAGVASTTRRESAQIIEVLVRQFGELLLAPMVKAAWELAAGPDEGDQPRLSITIKD